MDDKKIGNEFSPAFTGVGCTFFPVNKVKANAAKKEINQNN
jgi:hypothetical protein